MGAGDHTACLGNSTDSVWPRAFAGEGKEPGRSPTVKNLVGRNGLRFAPVFALLILPLK